MTRTVWTWLAVAAVVVAAGVVTVVLVAGSGVERSGAGTPPSTTTKAASPGECETGEDQLVLSFSGAGDDADQAMRAAADELTGDPDIQAVETLTRQQNYERFTTIFADDPDLVENVRPEDLPAAIWVVPAPGVSTQDLGERLGELTGADDVNDDACRAPPTTR